MSHFKFTFDLHNKECVRQPSCGDRCGRFRQTSGFPTTMRCSCVHSSQGDNACAHFVKQSRAPRRLVTAVWFVVASSLLWCDGGVHKLTGRTERSACIRCAWSGERARALNAYAAKILNAIKISRVFSHSFRE